MEPEYMISFNRKKEFEEWLNSLEPHDKCAINGRSRMGNLPYINLAAVLNRFDMVKKLCEAGANRYSKGRNGESLLYCACMSRNCDLVKWLLESHFLDPNEKLFLSYERFQGMHILEAVAKNADYNMCELLLKYGASPFARIAAKTDGKKSKKVIMYVVDYMDKRYPDKPKKLRRFIPSLSYST